MWISHSLRIRGVHRAKKAEARPGHQAFLPVAPLQARGQQRATELLERLSVGFCQKGTWLIPMVHHENLSLRKLHGLLVGGFKMF